MRGTGEGEGSEGKAALNSEGELGKGEGVEGEGREEGHTSKPLRLAA